VFVSLAKRVTPGVATYSLNRAAVAHARKLIDAKQYVLDSDWGDVQPHADDQNAYLEHHSWEEYALWHLGLTDGANDETKARHAFVYGDFRRIHRTGLIACVYRASEWRHKEVELAAHDLLQYLDSKTLKKKKKTSKPNPLKPSQLKPSQLKPSQLKEAS
jgi:hypothetical protein